MGIRTQARRETRKTGAAEMQTCVTLTTNQKGRKTHKDKKDRNTYHKKKTYKVKQEMTKQNKTTQTTTALRAGCHFIMRWLKRVKPFSFSFVCYFS